MYRKDDYPDGVTREMWFPQGTPIEQTHLVKAMHELWKREGVVIDPPSDLSAFPRLPLPASRKRPSA